MTSSTWSARRCPKGWDGVSDGRSGVSSGPKMLAHVPCGALWDRGPGSVAGSSSEKSAISSAHLQGSSSNWLSIWRARFTATGPLGRKRRFLSAAAGAEEALLVRGCWSDARASGLMVLPSTACHSGKNSAKSASASAEAASRCVPGGEGPVFREDATAVDWLTAWLSGEAPVRPSSWWMIWRHSYSASANSKPLGSSSGGACPHASRRSPVCGGGLPLSCCLTVVSHWRLRSRLEVVSSSPW
mmetsp:Transcript_114966/g.199990  ORF Transcript_114966/g.199990 Transcript_114966/m.199990 type:complete len:243 (+) Transcript_114966:766-1494(+)